MGKIVCLGGIVILFRFLEHLDSGVGPPAEAPASLHIFARVWYYASHPRLFEWYWGMIAMLVAVKTLECVEETILPCITWRECLGNIVVWWVVALGMTRFDAYWHKDQLAHNG